MSSLLVRPLLAALLLLGFTARASGLVPPHRCPAAAPGEGGHRGHGQGHGAVPGPERCECVGQSCTTALVLPAARAGLAVPVSPVAWRLPASSAAAARPAVPHLLPFAQAPPA